MFGSPLSNDGRGRQRGSIGLLPVAVFTEGDDTRASSSVESTVERTVFGPIGASWMKARFTPLGDRLLVEAVVGG
jgi:hypothetical protein